MAYKASVIANELLKLAREDGDSIDPMKLQKLLYLAHGWSLAFLHRPLIQEKIKAWKYGPVIPSVYDEFRKFRANPITREASGSEQACTLDAASCQLIRKVWATYRNQTAMQLSAMTHEPGYAWDLTQRMSRPWEDPTMEDGLVLDEFQRRMQRNQALR
ncbi:MAG: Panacea domain-containing protein [Acidobacteriaceae bacterium]